jgi:hypothetical protein
VTGWSFGGSQSISNVNLKHSPLQAYFDILSVFVLSTRTFLVPLTAYRSIASPAMLQGLPRTELAEARCVKREEVQEDGRTRSRVSLWAKSSWTLKNAPVVFTHVKGSTGICDSVGVCVHAMFGAKDLAFNIANSSINIFPSIFAKYFATSTGSTINLCHRLFSSFGTNKTLTSIFNFSFINRGVDKVGQKIYFAWMKIKQISQLGKIQKFNVAHGQLLIKLDR